MNTFRLVESAWQDFTHGLRQLRRNPVFATAGVAIMALGIAATTVIFSIAYGVMLRELPYDQPGELVTIGSPLNLPGEQRTRAGAADYFDWRRQQQVFQEMALTRPIANYNLTGTGEPERLLGARTTATAWRASRRDPLAALRSE